MLPRRPLPPHSDPTLALNRSEWVYLACEGPIGTLNQPYILRFDTPLSAEAVKQAVRRMLSAYPRLRGVLEATPRRYRLRILPDDADLDVLLDHAFRVEDIDLDHPETLRQWQERAVNDPLPLERGLGIRCHFVPHPERPALMWTVHHLLGDGRSMIMCIQALVKLLNGQDIEDLPVENPSMLPAVLPERWWQWPHAIWSAWRANRAEAREKARYEIVRLPARRMERYLTCGVLHQASVFPTKVLSAAAKQRGGSTNSMLMAATGTALLDLDGNRAGTAALVRLSVDLRRYFPAGQAPQMGNHVAVFDVVLPAHVPQAERTAWMDKAVREGLLRFSQRTLILPLLPYEWLGWLHVHTYSRLLMWAKREDKTPKVSCHTTNIGSVDAFNPEGATVRLLGMWPIVTSPIPLLGFVGVGGQQMMVCSYLRDEFSDQVARKFMEQVQQVLTRWVAEAPP